MVGARYIRRKREKTMIGFKRWASALLMRFALILGAAGAMVFSASGALVLSASGARAADYPDRPVTFVVGYAPGGGSDILTRLVGAALAQSWGQQVLVENRAGADGSIAANYVAHAAPDGYTMLMVTNSHVMPPQGYKLAYNPIKSFAPVSLVDTKPMVLLVNPSLGVHSVKQLMALAKAKPGQLNYGTDGPATDPAMMMLMFMQRTGIDLTQVGFKGGGQSQIALLGGEIQTVFGTLSAAIPDIKAGKLIALAVTTADRSPTLPEVPSLAQAAGVAGYNEGSWNGILVPAGTPQAIIDKIRQAVVAITKTPELQKRMAALGIQPIASTPGEFAKFLTDESTKMAALFKNVNAK
jgi:tripartite-type tricarboxylate transporter receptor subunit TctC